MVSDCWPNGEPEPRSEITEDRKHEWDGWDSWIKDSLGINRHILSWWARGVQSPPKRIVFRFHYHSQKVIGFLGIPLICMTSTFVKSKIYGIFIHPCTYLVWWWWWWWRRRRRRRRRWWWWKTLQDHLLRCWWLHALKRDKIWWMPPRWVPGGGPHVAGAWGWKSLKEWI